MARVVPKLSHQNRLAEDQLTILRAAAAEAVQKKWKR